MTSLFSRLQKLNKEARLPWTIRRDGGEVDILDGDGYSVAHTDAGWRYTSRNVGMAVESVNSLPAVLNLIEAAREVADANHDPMRDDIRELRAAVAVFVSGQEDAP